MSAANENAYPTEIGQMLQLYTRVMGVVSWPLEGRYTVRVWDGMDGVWCDVVANVDLKTALATWCEHTNNGTERTRFDEIDYYRIYPADTRMLYGSGFTMFRDDE